MYIQAVNTAISKSFFIQKRVNHNNTFAKFVTLTSIQATDNGTRQ